jgi:hypothetical protein
MIKERKMSSVVHTYIVYALTGMYVLLFWPKSFKGLELSILSFQHSKTSRMSSSSLASDDGVEESLQLDKQCKRFYRYTLLSTETTRTCY